MGAGKALLGQCGSVTPRGRAGTCTAFARTQPAWKTPPRFYPLLAWGNPWVSTACGCPWGQRNVGIAWRCTWHTPGGWEQYLTCEPCPAGMLPSCPQGPKPWDGGSGTKQGTALRPSSMPGSGGWVCPGPSPLVGSIGHQPTCLEWRGQRMSQLSPAQGQRGRAAGEGAKREWDLRVLSNPTTCKDDLQVLLPVSWALQLGTVALGL